jgi:hypothetical protein
VKRSKSNCGTTGLAPTSSRGSQKTRSEGRSVAPLVERSSPPDVELVVKHYDRGESASALSERKRLFLTVGDEVTHMRYEEWGMGVVMEVMTSSVPGGTCLARVRFQDGHLRCFNNDLDNESCCYYFGVRRYWNPSHGVNALRSKFFLGG